MPPKHDIYPIDAIRDRSRLIINSQRLVLQHTPSWHRHAYTFLPVQDYRLIGWTRCCNDRQCRQETSLITPATASDAFISGAVQWKDCRRRAMHGVMPPNAILGRLWL